MPLLLWSLVSWPLQSRAGTPSGAVNTVVRVKDFSGMWAYRLTLLTLQRFRPLFARGLATLIRARTVWTGDVRTALTGLRAWH